MEELSSWERVKIARGSERPTTFDYVGKIFDRFLELHGDRACKDDGALVGGIATINGVYVTVIGQQKGRNMKQNMKRNFGMPNPEGYRKALRLMKQAEKFHRPIICFIDTPGAFCGIEAEERGQGEAIAKNLYEMSSLKVPILSIVIGEGGSGGALALAVANEVWMLENSTYSILSPEGFASILWKDSKRCDEAASIMKITASDLLDMGIIDQVIKEQPEELDLDFGNTLPEIIEKDLKDSKEKPSKSKEKDREKEKLKNHLTVDNMDYASFKLKEAIIEFLLKYQDIPSAEIVESRYDRFRKI
ncbi:MAG: acetyl-CoA carboxylase carboxyltransferase subunit alpha [Lachnospiraceae bacterium]|nr:acetyl-CoA carboxylase carboxyltransferase subunit alpha [Lachnospiraceae bacterium]